MAMVFDVRRWSDSTARRRTSRHDTGEFHQRAARRRRCKAEQLARADDEHRRRRFGDEHTSVAFSEGLGKEHATMLFGVGGQSTATTGGRGNGSRALQ